MPLFESTFIINQRYTAKYIKLRRGSTSLSRFRCLNSLDDLGDDASVFGTCENPVDDGIV